MAITNAQQYQQLVNKPANGKRPGYRGDAAARSTGAKQSGRADPGSRSDPGEGRASKGSGVSESTGGFAPTKGVGAGVGPTGRDAVVTADTLRRNQLALDAAKYKRGQQALDDLTVSGVRFPTYFPGSTFLNIGLGATEKFRQRMLDKNVNFFKNLSGIENKGYPKTEEGYREYMRDRLAGKIDAAGNTLITGDADPTRGNEGDEMIPLPDEDESEDQESEYVNPLSLLTPRIAGTQFAADGGRIGFRIGSDEGKDTSGRDYASDTAASRSVKTSPSRNTDGGGDDRGGPKGPPRVINPPPKEKKSFRDLLKTTKEKTQPFRDFLFLRDLATGNIPGALRGIATQLLPISQKGIANPNLVTGNIVYDERLGLIDATTGEPIDNTMPDAQQIKTFNTKEDLVGMGAAKDSFFDTLTPEGKALEKFRKSAVGFKEAEANPRNDPQSALNFMLDRPGLYGDVIENKDFIQGAIDKGFLETEQDYTDQLPLGKAVDLADGGIANLEREAFFLGGLTKGLKKAVRGVKKIAKSPIGKAALIGAGFGLAGMGPFKGLFASGKGLGFKNFMTNKLFGTLTAAGHPTEAPVRMGGLFNLIKSNPIPSIFAASALAGLAAPKQDEDEFDIAKYYAKNQLTPSQSVRGMGSEFDFYNYNLAEGGTPRKEPVAKKTLPLIDMDGMEKDYRETGGFVEMGRMEKADDVPARLSKNEFVFTADAVRNAGEGDIDKGAEVMYNMMKNLEAGGEVSEESQGLEGAREMFQTSQRLGEVI